MQRRTVLASFGSISVGLQAGCLANDTTPPASNGDDDGNETRSETDVEPTVADHVVETTETDCMTDEGDQVAVEFGPESVTLDGVATAPNPCHEARIASATVETGELIVRIEFESTDDVCVECVGAISYASRIDIDGADGLDTVTVEHDHSDSTHTVKRGDDDEEDR